MRTKTLVGAAVALVVLMCAAAYLHFGQNAPTGAVLDATPKQVTLSGTYVCLPHKNTSGPQTTECAFGIKTDEGDYYAVNFGQSSSALQQFQSGAHIRAEGFVVAQEALSSDHWQQYNMKGIFTITQPLGQPTSTPTERID